MQVKAAIKAIAASSVFRPEAGFELCSKGKAIAKLLGGLDYTVNFLAYPDCVEFCCDPGVDSFR
jgi:hypothetical protein